jgi:hypothetical protein
MPPLTKDPLGKPARIREAREALVKIAFDHNLPLPPSFQSLGRLSIEDLIELKGFLESLDKNVKLTIAKATIDKFSKAEPSHADN